jgi:hypothetical protein
MTEPSDIDLEHPIEGLNSADIQRLLFWQLEPQRRSDAPVRNGFNGVPQSGPGDALNLSRENGSWIADLK